MTARRFVAILVFPNSSGYVVRIESPDAVKKLSAGKNRHALVRGA